MIDLVTALIGVYIREAAKKNSGQFFVATKLEGGGVRP